MQDILLLTLYKQHYLDKYEKSMDCAYSCWGYYDGLDLRTPQKMLKDEKENMQGGEKISGKTTWPSVLWHMAGEQKKTLKGGYSSQDIAIFRCIPQDKEEKTQKAEALEFWEKMELYPYIAVGFVQIEKKRNFRATAEKIEETNDKFTASKVLSYCTFDNADLVIIFRGNSIEQIIMQIKEIENIKDIKYMHSILGVSEEYLKSAEKKDGKLELPSIWNGFSCGLEEKIRNLTMQLVTSGDNKVIQYMDTVLKDWDSICSLEYTQREYSYTIGHESINLVLYDTNVDTLLKLVLPQGPGTHQNKLYGKMIYNIETSFTMKQQCKVFDRKQEIAVDVNSEDYKGIFGETDSNTGYGLNITWCEEMIHQYHEEMKNSYLAEDTSLNSYYQEIIHTLNTLSQYERFGMSRDIFYLVFPAFNMFQKQLSEAISKLGQETQKEAMKVIKKAINSFMNSVNSVIYHTIHTDQMFLMIPGYSGTSFSIPMKLSLFYLWMIEQVALVLNDSSYEYKYILEPVAETIPRTKAIKFKPDNMNRLICVQLSQRSMFHPKDLILILSHEIAHYVNDKLRKRKLRKKLMINTISDWITEEIYFGICSEKLNEICSRYVEDRREKIRVYLNDILERDITENCGNQNFYGDDVSKILKKTCREVLGSQTGGMVQIISGLPSALLKEIKSDETNYIKNLKEISNIQKNADIKRRKMFAEGKLMKDIPTLMQYYREIFSDAAALSILEYKENDFKHALEISEGCSFVFSKKKDSKNFRISIISGLITNKKPNFNEGETKIKKEIEMLNNLWEYADACYKELKKRVGEDVNKKRIEDIQDLFSKFENTQNNDYTDIYTCINNKICDYRESVWKDGKYCGRGK